MVEDSDSELQARIYLNRTTCPYLVEETRNLINVDGDTVLEN